MDWPGRRLAPAALALSILCAALLPFLDAAAHAEGRPKIGLALSGGGARGAAHIGVLKVLEEHRVPIDYVVGTSMGSIVGGLYATGLSAAELDTLLTNIDWAEAFNDWIPREDRSFRRKRDDDLYLVKNKPGLKGHALAFPLGILDGEKIELILKRCSLPVVGIRDFDRLGIPFRAVATDVATGETIVLDHGDLALAMRASMSLPVVFAPREIDGRLLIDGGVSCNLPIDVLRRMGADIIIAVDIGSPLAKRDELTSVIAVTDQFTTIMTRRNADEQIATLTDRDIFIRPDLGDITTASFARAREAIPSGAEAAERVADKLDALSVSAEEYERYARGRRPPRARPVIDAVRIVNRSRIGDGVIAARLHVVTGTPLDVDRLESDIEQIYGLELFESVTYDVVNEPNCTVLVVTARERSWGPNYLQFGAAVFDDFEGPNFNLSAAYTRTAINRWNGEWRTGFQVGQEPGIFTDFHQPIGRALHGFVAARASFREWSRSVFDGDGRKLSELGMTRYGVELAAGRELGTWGEIRGGVSRDAGTIKVQVGDPSKPNANFDTGESFAQLYIDRLDDVNFPRSGAALRTRGTAGLTELGSANDYEQLSADGSIAKSIGRTTGRIRAYVAATRDGDAPVQSVFSLGGFTRLSGFQQDELAGQNAALVSALLYRRMWEAGPFAVYAGLSAEYGNVYRSRSEMTLESGVAAGSVFLGVETIMGPLYIAYGRAERGRENFYLFLGKVL